MTVEKKEWDAAASAIDNDPMRPYRYAMAIKYFKDVPRNAKILEVGCGEGSGLSYLTQLGFCDLSGVDVSKERIIRARNKLPENVVLQEIELDGSLPFKNERFDIVISLAVIEHVEDINHYLKEIYRVSKSDGIIIISSDCYSWRLLQITRRYISFQPKDKTYTYNRFERFFNYANMEIKHFAVFNLPSRGNVLIHYFFAIDYLQRIWIKFFKKRSITSELNEIEIIRRNLDNQKDFFKFLNFIYDENIFLLKKLNPN